MLVPIQLSGRAGAVQLRCYNITWHVMPVQLLCFTSRGWVWCSCLCLLGPCLMACMLWNGKWLLMPCVRAHEVVVHVCVHLRVGQPNCQADAMQSTTACMPSPVPPASPCPSTSVIPTQTNLPQLASGKVVLLKTSSLLGPARGKESRGRAHPSPHLCLSKCTRPRSCVRWPREGCGLPPCMKPCQPQLPGIEALQRLGSAIWCLRMPAVPLSI
jgi:hypothetical protein